MIYTVGGIKGGSGKTTISTNLTISLAKQGYTVLLVDADDQKTASKFTTLRSQNNEGNIGYTLVQLTEKSVRDQILKLKDCYDHIVIDVGGRDTTSQRAALSVTDLYLVPFAPRSFDIWTLPEILVLYNEMKVFNPSLKVASFLNKADTSTRGSDNNDAIDLLKGNPDIPYVDIQLGNRKSFANAASQGQGIVEFKPKDSKAIEEFNRLYEYCVNMC